MGRWVWANLAEQLEGDLRQCAADIGLPDAPSEGEFHSILGGTPIFEVPPLGMVIGRPVLASLFGRRMAERQVAGQISRRLRQPFYGALETYWHLVGEWAESVIGQLKRRYETYAENYRAPAGRILGGGELTRDELVVLEEDLGRLKPTEAVRTALRPSDLLRRIDVTQEIS